MNQSVSNKDRVLKLIGENRSAIKSLGVRKLGLFGSFARDEQNDQSDVDLIVEFEPDKKSFDNFVQLAYLLEDLLGRRVELVTPESLSPYIGPRILKEVEYAT
ncbi:MAG: nucleotidyltransferase family protein [Chloroflexi bacterium]|nr:nucleotidyltransferase family protein [Chloroflexota bacterium]